MKLTSHMVSGGKCKASGEVYFMRYNEIQEIVDKFDERGRLMPGDTFLWLMGRQIENLDVDTMARIWIIAGHYITCMYKRRIASREGVG